MTKEELIKLHEQSSNNRDKLKKYLLCGCFYCAETFHPSEIEEWAVKDTAICPRCGIDSVIPLTIGATGNIQMLEEMFDYWFDRGVSYKMKDGQVVEKSEWHGKFRPGGIVKETEK
jgi:hypothetical protein